MGALVVLTTPAAGAPCAAAGDWDRKLPLRDRAIQLVTDIFARHGQNGAKYTFTHNLAGGVPPGLIDGGHLEGKVPPEMMSHLKP